jgi:nitrite reductase/ring-hydroxylating ferredoxin subunit
MTRVLCGLAELDATGAKEIVFDDNGARVSVFVVKYGGAIHGYVNSCPHARLPLNWRDDQFFDTTGLYLLCANHSAYFDIQTGQCVRGPCKGQFLNAFNVVIKDNEIVTA